MSGMSDIIRGADHPSYSAFHRDLEKLNAAILGLGAVVEHDDGFLSIDESKVPDLLMRTYWELVLYGAANGLDRTPSRDKVESLPLEPESSVARRGQLAVLVERPTTWHGEWCRLVEVASVTRTGEVRAYRDVAYPTAVPTRVSTTGRSVRGLVDASMLDRDRAVEIARSHTWPEGQPFQPWDNLDEARAALRPAKRASAA